MLSPSNIDNGLFGVNDPLIVGTDPAHSFSTGVAASSSKVAKISFPEQPAPVVVLPGLSTITAVVPAGDFIVTIRSPTQVCEMFKFTSKSVMETFSVTFIVTVTPVGLLSGIAVPGLLDCEPVIGIFPVPIHTISGGSLVTLISSVIAVGKPEQKSLTV
ncbi:hypothetical protein AEQU3_02627 [Aequorivita antarctica]|nr:hypothetical protein AEQU3_02627 [Aequorivita antarctica]